MGSEPTRGFTLLEVIAAMAIMAIVLVAVYRLHAQTISMNNAVRFHTLAPLLAQARLTAVAIDPDSRDSGNGDFGTDYPGYTWEVTIEDVVSEYLGESGKNLKMIEITISLNENESNYRIRTYRMIPDRE
ncbi:MAG: type II secretion system minor pseudopilin GspI [Desulfococcus multivorans]|uniref:type II secretion system minor pseudopilin GspI n=1 Tax=Desulfococcus sp. TaxID=2025834 RepID=UPI00058B4157|nr:conserved uncharacterized protein, prepilin domain [Desulfococcus multivorans]MDX9817283.1 type II secretion system minor pseudopilin GspI [Desulfococcus multivorans]